MNGKKSFHNAIIGDIGLYYIPHYGSMTVQIELYGGDWTQSVDVNLKNMKRFVRTVLEPSNESFDEDGMYIHHLKGTPVKVSVNGESPASNRIVAIGRILADDDDENDFIQVS